MIHKLFILFVFSASLSTVSAETLVMRMRSATLALWNVGDKPAIRTASDSVYVTCNGHTVSYDPLDVISIRLSDRSIEELEKNPDEAADKSILITDFTIKINGVNNHAALFSADGKRIAEQKANGTIEFAKPKTPGVYVVEIDGEHTKIIVQ